MSIKSEKISEGVWKNGSSWEFHLSDNMPDTTLVSAAFSIPIYDECNIALTKSHRGWELPGGHLDAGEKIEEALIRETREEAGVDLINYKLIGFRKIICKKPMPNREGGYYPMIGYIPHYLGEINEKPLSSPEGEDIIEARLFSYQELKNMNFGGVELVNFLMNKGII